MKRGDYQQIIAAQDKLSLGIKTLHDYENIDDEEMIERKEMEDFLYDVFYEISELE